MGLTALGVIMASTAESRQVHLQNPHGRRIYACGSMQATDLPEGQSYVAVDAGTGEQCGVQLDNGQVTVGAVLGPHEGTVLELRPGELPPETPTVSVSRLQDGSVVLENAYYRLVLNASKGYTVTGLADKERGAPLPVTFGGVFLKRKTVRAGNTFPDPGGIGQSDSVVDCRIEQDGPLVAQVVLTWSCELGAVREVVTAYAGSRMVEYDVSVKTAAPLDHASVALDARAFGARAVVMPDNRRLSGGAWVQRYRPAPCRVAGFDPESSATLGILTAPTATGTVGVYLSHTPEGTAENAFGAQVYSSYLAHAPVGAEVRFTAGLLIGGGRDVLDDPGRQVADRFVLRPASGAVVRSPGLPTPWAIVGEAVSIQPQIVIVDGQAAEMAPVTLLIEGAALEATEPSALGFRWTPRSTGTKKVEVGLGARTFAYDVDVKRAAEIVRWWPDKLILPRGGIGTGTATIRSNVREPRQYALTLTRITGIDEQEVVWREDLTLAGGEQGEVAVEWKGGEREYGRELQLSLVRAGKLVDAHSEYTTLGDDYPRLVQLAVVNPGWFRHEGHQKWMIPLMREGYTGILEYYDWAPDSQYDIAPERERWEPHTDSQVAYRTSIGRSFLKNTIALAHEHGLKMVAELNGMAGLPRAMEHPDELMYTEEGQPWIYNRRVYEDGTEFATIFRDYFNEERVVAWADAMGTSAKVYGWDGVRFDTTFRPTLYTGDPYYQTHNIGNLGTYTSEGVRRTELYEDPDAAGAELLRLWRQRTREHEPGFRFLTNFCHTRALQETFPKYTAAAASDGGWLLQEQVIYTSREYNTIEGWVDELRAEGENLRSLGGVPAAGDMAWGPSGYGSLMQLTAFACGYHLMSYAGTRHRPDDNIWKQYRFALRYAEYFYAPDMEWLPADQTVVTVKPDAGILWQDLVYRRELADGRTQYIVDLVNLPEDSEKMYMNHAPASVKRNIHVVLSAGSPDRPVKAFLLVPEPEPHALALDAVHGPGGTVTTIEELHQFAMPVLEQ